MYIIKDILGGFYAQTSGSDIWTQFENCAETYATYDEAKAALKYVSKIAKIRKSDLVIIEL